MRNIILVLSLIIITSCSDEYKAEQTLVQLNREISKKEGETLKIGIAIKSQQDLLDKINKSIETKIYDLPEETKIYVILLEVKQKRVLGVFDKNYTKNHMNKLKFPIEVSKTFYDSYQVGDKLKKEFRVGSFLLNGSMSSWVIKIKQKDIVLNL
tara:strand:+ start:110 stop:571 length:462 start_codon:yes stop_codon:yes gene_type:complete